MNTPAHMIINLYILRDARRARYAAAVALGSFLPDLPMFVFYFYEKIVLKIPEKIIWYEHYYAEFWQDLFNFMHSIPLTIIGLGLSLYKNSRTWTLLFGSMLLHNCEDIISHNDDAHAHFYPLSNWKFFSPISYWDPRFYGHIAGPVEFIITLALGVLLLRYYRSNASRCLVVFCLGIYMLYGCFGYLVWMT